MNQQPAGVHPPHSLFSAPLIDAAQAFADARFAGIWVPAPELDRPRIGITGQFLEQANQYHERYTNTAYFRKLIETALTRLEPVPEAPVVLDLGSGSGNSVFPMLTLFPRAEVVAIDLSPQLLAILKRHVDTNPDHAARLHMICLDACANHYNAGSFDIVVGAAILHHLIDPFAALSTVYSALKPGGVAMFFEPFENGNAVLMLAYEAIIDKSQSQEIRDDIITLLANLVYDFRHRMALRDDPVRMADMDDKWIFSRSFFLDAAQRIGYAGIEIVPLHAVNQPFRNQTRANLSLGLGLPPEALPEWAWGIIDHFDSAFSPELRSELPIEAMVLLRKA